MLSFRAAPLSSASGKYRCVSRTAASEQPVMTRFATFSCPPLARLAHRRQGRAAGSLFPSASAPTDSRSKVLSNTLPLKHRSLVLGPSGVQVTLYFPSPSGLTLPSSGPAFGGPLKSNVSRQVHNHACCHVHLFLRCFDGHTVVRLRRHEVRSSRGEWINLC